MNSIEGRNAFFRFDPAKQPKRSPAFVEFKAYPGWYIKFCRDGSIEHLPRWYTRIIARLLGRYPEWKRK